VIPAPWFALTDVLAPVGGQPGIAGWAGVPGVLVQVLLVGVAGPAFARFRRPVRARAWHSLVVYAATGALRAAVLVGLAPSVGFWTDWVWLAPSRVLASMIWLTGAALVLHWIGQVRARRTEFGTEFTRLTHTRARDEAALAEADDDLAAVRAETQTALGEIGNRLGARMTEADLREVVEQIDDVVAELVRPTSHSLARMPAEIPTADVQRLWMRRRRVVPAVIRAWPAAAPYQPLLVALLCLPMVLTAGLVPPPHALTAAGLVGLAGLAVQVLFLVAARRLLLPPLQRIGQRHAVVVVFCSYLLLFVAGVSALLVLRSADAAGPLEAFLAPATITAISGGVAAAGLAQSQEAAAARAVIRRTQWDLRRTRQRLWAQRRRLAMALHGRVQANLTAAGLVLSRAADGLAAGQPLDPGVIAQVRQTLVLAAWIDNAPPSPARERLASIAAVWAGVLDVALDLRPNAEDALEANRDAADACSAVLREILLNAVRHGGASSADVVVGLDHSTVCVRVRETRPGPPPPAGTKSKGLGRSLIDSLAVDWAERDAPDGRTTVVLLAAGDAPGVADAAVRLDDVSGLG
jgi:signal transduction histidine kinase